MRRNTAKSPVMSFAFVLLGLAASNLYQHHVAGWYMFGAGMLLVGIGALL